MGAGRRILLTSFSQSRRRACYTRHLFFGSPGGAEYGVLGVFAAGASSPWGTVFRLLGLSPQTGLGTVQRRWLRPRFGFWRHLRAPWSSEVPPAAPARLLTALLRSSSWRALASASAASCLSSRCISGLGHPSASALMRSANHSLSRLSRLIAGLTVLVIRLISTRFEMVAWLQASISAPRFSQVQSTRTDSLRTVERQPPAVP